MRKKYGIKFTKEYVQGRYRYDAIADSEQWLELAYHISNSSRSLTEIQIKDMALAIKHELVQKDWGEIPGGSFLTVYVKEGYVTVSYSDAHIPVDDFKQLLEEWLEYIN